MTFGIESIQNIILVKTTIVSAVRFRIDCQGNVSCQIQIELKSIEIFSNVIEKKSSEKLSDIVQYFKYTECNTFCAMTKPKPVHIRVLFR